MFCSSSTQYNICCTVANMFTLLVVLYSLTVLLKGFSCIDTTRAVFFAKCLEDHGQAGGVISLDWSGIPRGSGMKCLGTGSLPDFKC